MFGKSDCRILNLGTIDYSEALRVQKKVLEDVISNRAPNTLIICQHPHVITFSRHADRRNILASKEELERLGVALCFSDRGGDVTYHGPGQLVIYPIFDLKQDKKDIHFYIERLEEVVINALRDNFGLNAYRMMDFSGIWVGPYKVGSIGISIRRWVTCHGLSLNVKADKKFFSLIRPCGLDVKMASINDFFDDKVSIASLQDMLLNNFKKIFNLEFLKDAQDDKSLLAGIGREY